MSRPVARRARLATRLHPARLATRLLLARLATRMLSARLATRLLAARLAARSLAALTGLAVLIGGCGSSGVTAVAAHTGSNTGASDSGTTHVVMRFLEFNPTKIHAKVGQTVTWSNEDTSPHNVTYVNGPRFKSSRHLLEPGAKFSIKLTGPGTIRYVCTLHPWMKATIVVSP